MQITFLVNFIVCFIQLGIGERSYTHSQIIPPSLAFGFLCGLWIGATNNWLLAVSASGACFLLKFLTSSLRFAFLIWRGIEIESRAYLITFAVFALGETALIWGVTR